MSFALPYLRLVNSLTKILQLYSIPKQWTCSELVKKVDTLSGSIDTLTKNQEPLIKDVGDLKEQIARIDERTGNLLTIVIAGIIGLFVTIVAGVILQIIFAKKQTIQYIPHSAPRLEELEQTEQEEQRKYEYEPEGVTS